MGWPGKDEGDIPRVVPLNRRRDVRALERGLLDVWEVM
jgi:hypothetical protein